MLDHRWLEDRVNTAVAAPQNDTGLIKALAVGSAQPRDCLPRPLVTGSPQELLLGRNVTLVTDDLASIWLKPL